MRCLSFRLPVILTQGHLVLPTLRTRMGQRPKNNGAPTLIFVAGAALRVADVTRVLKDKRLRGEKGGDVAKLFAKHFKLEEHVAYLKRTKIAAAVGTPGRLGKLLCDTGAFSLQHRVGSGTYTDRWRQMLSRRLLLLTSFLMSHFETRRSARCWTFRRLGMRFSGQCLVRRKSSTA